MACVLVFWKEIFVKSKGNIHYAAYGLCPCISKEIFVKSKGNRNYAAYGLCPRILERKYLWKVKEIETPQPMACVFLFWTKKMKSKGNIHYAAYGSISFYFEKKYLWKVNEILVGNNGNIEILQPMVNFLFMLKGNNCEK